MLYLINIEAEIKTYRGRSKKRHSRITSSYRRRRGKSRWPRNRDRWWDHLQDTYYIFNINLIDKSKLTGAGAWKETAEECLQRCGAVGRGGRLVRCAAKSAGRLQ